MSESVIEILEGYLALEKLKQEINYKILSWTQKDEFRLKNDNDAKFYYVECELEKNEALKADTIISFWTPYCRLLKLEANWTVGMNAKTIGNLEVLLKQTRATWENEYTSKIKKINENLESFANMCYTSGNYMLLPERQMNPQRFRFAEDRIDLSLYECFDNGPLSKFFIKEDLEVWINKQKLEGVFKEGTLSMHSINWFVKEEKPKLFSEMNATEIYEYLDNAVKFIEERNEKK